MGTKWTLKHIENLKKEKRIIDFKINGKEQNTEKKSKYGNKKVEFEGRVFDSKKELARFLELRILEKVGEIKDLRLQVPYELNEGGTHSLVYVCDFVYQDKSGQMVYEDVKGYRTKV